MIQIFYCLQLNCIEDLMQSPSRVVVRCSHNTPLQRAKWQESCQTEENMFYYYVTVSCLLLQTRLGKYESGYIYNCIKTDKVTCIRWNYFTSFFTDQNHTPNVNKNGCVHKRWNFKRHTDGSQFVRWRNKLSSFKTHFTFSENPSFLDFLPLSLIGRMLFEQHTKQSICFSLTGVCVAILDDGHVMKISRDDGLFSEPTTEVNGEWTVVQESVFW